MNRKLTLRPYLTAIILLLIILLATTASIASGPSIERAKLVASDAAQDDRFGHAVALDGDTALIGAPEPLIDPSGPNTGLAYVFTRSGTTWSQQAKLTASDGANSDIFGVSVAVSGDTALVGAKSDSDDGLNSGSVYVFTRSDTNWSQQAKLTPSDGAYLSRFGESVAVDGDTALISGRLDDNGVATGSVYVFTRSGTTWSEQVKLTASDGAVGDAFGFGLALDDDTAVIGAYGDDDAGNISGSAYIFVGSGASWSEQAKLAAADGEAEDHFGWSVALSGETALVGSRWGDSVSGDSGSAYVFTRSGISWSQQAKLTASDATAGDEFGVSVGLDGDVALVGARLDDDNGTNSGSAYVFTRSGVTWSEAAKLTAGDGAPIDHFGWSVAQSGNMALIGADKNDDGGSNSGSAYVFVPDNQPPTAAAGGPYLGPVNEPIAFDGSGSTDPDGDALAHDWDFDDGNMGAGAMPAHSYATAGIYDVCLIVNDGSVDSVPDCTMAVIYDPDGGFVTGGGWIDSPAGADVVDATAAGRANFGFVSKYKKGADSPTGQTEFQFTAGGLDFHSSSYDWLVIAGAHAKYKGVGTINGSGNYGFMLTATDRDIQGGGTVDSFRIKIWDIDDNDAAIYDNQPGAGEYGYDGTELGAGNIKIHKG